MFNRRFLRLKVIKTLYGYLSDNSSTLAQIEQNLEKALHQSYLLYLYLLYLPVSLRHHAQLRAAQVAKKIRPTPEELTQHRNLINNSVINTVQKFQPLTDVLQKHCLKWNANNDSVKKIYDKWSSSNSFKEYQNLSNPTFEEDQNVVIQLYENTLPEFQELYNTLEEISIFWDCDETDFFLDKAGKSYLFNEKTPFSLKPIYANEQDREFPRELVKYSITNYTKHIELLNQHILNWECDRVAQIDLILLITSIAEITSFEKIPIRVTLNEYVEIAKFYGTPNSSTFVNGVLDKIVKYLTTNHLIEKTSLGQNM